MSIDEDVLLTLLSAPSKEIIDDLLTTCFRFRLESVPKRKIIEWKEAFETSQEAIEQIVTSTTILVRRCLFESVLPTSILSDSFHKNLGSLLNKVVKTHAPLWKQHIQENQVSPARLIGYDCRLDTTTATDEVTQVNKSRLLLSLQVQDAPTQTGVMPLINTIQLELGPQEVNTLLDGMLKIRDQLNSMQ